MRQAVFSIARNSVLTGALLCSPAAMAAGPEDVHWCLTGDATYTILQQPMRDYCPDVLAGAAVGVWYAPQYAGWVATMTQKGWSNQAAGLACNNDPVSLTAAVGLIAACQCHNADAADWVLGHPAEVLAILRAHAGC